MDRSAMAPEAYVIRFSDNDLLPLRFELFRRPGTDRQITEAGYYNKKRRPKAPFLHFQMIGN
ncbi:MAG: hypothetical protein CMK07_01120 [Ponticaulis sp.]|nr:hypothetical protein [Ponticaulis sp.]